MSLGVAFKAFFAALFNRQAAERLRAALQAEPPRPNLTAPKLEPAATPKAAARPSQPVRSEALTLLATLQREARWLDLVHESLDGFEDAQIGAAAREVLRDCRKSLDRMFAIMPQAEAEEGATCQLPPQPSPAKYRLVGKSTGSSGHIAHRGWQATRCEVPSWSGQASDALLLAPIEVDVS